MKANENIKFWKTFHTFCFEEELVKQMILDCISNKTNKSIQEGRNPVLSTTVIISIPKTLPRI